MPSQLFHGALAPALVRGAVGVARRPTNAGQQSAQPNAEGSTANPAPSENRAGGFHAKKADEDLMQVEIEGSEWARRRLRKVAVPFKTWACPWPGVPP